MHSAVANSRLCVVPSGSLDVPCAGFFNGVGHGAEITGSWPDVCGVRCRASLLHDGVP